MLTSTERKFLIRALDKALKTKLHAMADVREMLEDKSLTFDDLIVNNENVINRSTHLEQQESILTENFNSRRRRYKIWFG